jgi:hypothetical protein
MVYYAWRRRWALSVALNDLNFASLLLVAKLDSQGGRIWRGHCAAVFVRSFSPRRNREAVLMRAYYGVHEVCYDLSLKMHFCSRQPLNVRRSP